MKIKNMSKRAISVFLSLMMCVSLLQVPAFAGTEPQYDEFGNLITTDATTTTEPETPVVTEPVVPETPVVPEDDAVVDNNSDVDVDTDADTEDDADANADADVEGDADANADADTEDDADANADANAEDNADANADADAEDDADANADANAEDDADANADADAEDEVDANADADVEDEADANADANVEDDANVNADANVEDDADVNAGADTVAPEDIGIQTLSLENPAVTAVSTVNDLLNAISSANNNEAKEIHLENDIDLNNSGVTIGTAKNIVLNLCGKTITGATDSLFTVEGNLTIKDEPQSNDDTGSEGKITNSKGRGFVVKNGGSLTLESGSITGNKSQDNGGGVIILKDSTFTMNDGSISNNSSASHRSGGGVYVDHDATFIMNDGTIAGNTTAHEGGGVFVDRNATFTMNGGTIDKNSAQNGGGVYVNGGKFTMDKGTINNNTVAGYRDTQTSSADEFDSSGGGVYVNGGNFTMNNGTISGNVAKDSGKSDSAATNYLNGNRGGGVYVAKGDNSVKGTFTMNNGTIKGNKAGEGGGVFVEYAAKNVWDSAQANQFSMNGGTVDNNDAYVGEGGGIYIRGIGEITKGYITNNRTHTVGDLGGGGVYVESGGVLSIINAAIFENAAKGLGGGLAACVHGFTSAVRLDGAAIFENESSGANGSVTKDTKTDGHDLWEGNDDFKGAAQDIFTASDNAQDTKKDAGAVIGNMMVGNGQSNWTGWNVTNNGKDKDGKPVYTWTKVDSKNNAYVESDRLLALTSNASKDAKDAAKDTAEVIISGNKSLYTHGGGVANNGVLTFGKEGNDTQFQQLPTLTVEKKVEGAEGLKDWSFSFGMKDESERDVNTGSATNENSKVTLEFDLENFDVSKLVENDTATYTFYVTENENGTLEEVTSGGTMTYDKSQYKITVTVTKEVVTDNDGANRYTFTSYSFSNPVIVKTYDAEGNEIIDGDNTVSDGIMDFVNKYEKPEEPEEPSVPAIPLVAYDPLNLTINKVLTVVNGTVPEEGEFNFKAEGDDFNANVSVSLKDLLENGNTASTTLTAGVKFDEEGKLKGYDFIVSELDEGMANVTYSKHSYKVSLGVDQKTDDNGIVHYFYVPTITQYDENGNEVTDVTTDIANNILTFINVFDKPNDTDPTDPTDPEEPTTPDNPPSTPDRPSRPTPPPTPEEPTIDIPDDDVPLAPAPEEPEVSIPDEDVPLAGEPPLVELPEPEVPLAPMPPETTTIPDPEVPLAGVPQTGDNAGGFYALMALAACGLVVLNLRKKENEI